MVYGVGTANLVQQVSLNHGVTDGVIWLSCHPAVNESALLGKGNINEV